MKRNTLLIDADDTLWENNVFFEKLIEDFITLVEPCGYSRAYIRHILNETERKNIRQYGYGVRSFGRSLEETYLKLADQMAKRRPWRRFTCASLNWNARRRKFSMACQSWRT
jgi:putative hydrolase of the HAD superfamily